MQNSNHSLLAEETSVTEKLIQIIRRRETGADYVEGPDLDPSSYHVDRAPRFPLIEFGDEDRDSLQAFIEWALSRLVIREGDIVNAFIPGEGDCASLVSYARLVHRRELMSHKKTQSYMQVTKDLALVVLPDLRREPF